MGADSKCFYFWKFVNVFRSVEIAFVPPYLFGVGSLGLFLFTFLCWIVLISCFFSCFLFFVFCLFSEL